MADNIGPARERRQKRRIAVAVIFRNVAAMLLSY